MISFLKKYYAFGIGILILIPIILFLQHIGFIIIPDDAPWQLILIFAFWWIIISLPIYKISYLKKNRRTVYKIIGLIALLIITLIIDSNWGMPDNPITMLLLVVFWLGFFYLLVPEFIKKYQKYIFIVYGMSMVYFTYARLFTGDLQRYLEHEKGMAMTLLVLPIPILILLWIYEQWKWLKTLKTDKANAELALLKTQINPHFFFNTLNNLYSLTVKHSDQAPAMILKLSDMMRYTIYEGKKEMVSLKEEVDYLNNYIELHKIRYHKSVDIQFNHEIDTNTSIAPLLFIILLENAFKHGVESLSDAAYIHMNLSSNENSLHFTIANNFDPKEIHEENGIGLDNLKQRLKLIYPKTHKLLIEKSKDRYSVDLIIETP
jgi:hypothetical protein